MIIPSFPTQCTPHKTMPKKTKMTPLKMILSKSAGARFQMDLIELPPFNGYDHMLRVVDHLSKFGYVYPVKTKTAEEVGKSLLCILSTSIMPSILQSDNGGEVSNSSIKSLYTVLSYGMLYSLFSVFFNHQLW